MVATLERPKHNKMDRAEAYSRGRSSVDWTDEYANEDHASGDVEAIPYLAKSYLCEGGAKLVHRDMVRRGMPRDFTGWLFITLTLDRELVDQDPEKGYKAGNARMRRFWQYLKRHGFDFGKKTKTRKIRKLEFHEESPDWPHWHLLLDTRRFIPWELIKRAWNLGGVDIERIEGPGHGEAVGKYEFKYVFKDVEHIPEWIKSYKRIRFIQTQNIFEPRESADKDKGDDLEDREDDSEEMMTIGERLESWARRVTIVMHIKEGIRVRAFDLNCQTTTLFGRLWAAPLRTRAIIAPFYIKVKKYNLILQNVRLKSEVIRTLSGLN